MAMEVKRLESDSRRVTRSKLENRVQPDRLKMKPRIKVIRSNEHASNKIPEIGGVRDFFLLLSVLFHSTQTDLAIALTKA